MLYFQQLLSRTKLVLDQQDQDENEPTEYLIVEHQFHQETRRFWVVETMYEKTIRTN